MYQTMLAELRQRSLAAARPDNPLLRPVDARHREGSPLLVSRPARGKRRTGLVIISRANDPAIAGHVARSPSRRTTSAPDAVSCHFFVRLTLPAAGVSVFR